MHIFLKWKQTGKVPVIPSFYQIRKCVFLVPSSVFFFFSNLIKFEWIQMMHWFSFFTVCFSFLLLLLRLNSFFVHFGWLMSNIQVWKCLIKDRTDQSLDHSSAHTEQFVGGWFGYHPYLNIDTVLVINKRKNNLHQHLNVLL